MSKPSDFIGTCAPIVRLFPYVQHNDPPYQPCSVDWYLDNIILHRGDGSTYQAPSGGHFDQSQLSTTDTQAYLQIPDPNATSSVRAGNLAAALAYVHIKPVGHSGLFDLQYWFDYAVRGRSTVRLAVNGSEGGIDLLAPPGSVYQGAGEHQGDWKHMTVRINGQGQIQAVFYAQHTGGFWCLPGEFQQVNGHPIVYSSRNTHSCYPTAGRYDQMGTLHGISLPGLSVHISLLEWTADGGEVLDCSQPGKWLLVYDESAPIAPTSVPRWLGFVGHWGPGLQEVVDPNTFGPLVDQVIGSFPWPLSKILGEFSGDIKQAIADEAQKNVANPQFGAETPPRQTPWLAGDVGWQTNWQPIVSSFRGQPGMQVTAMRRDPTRLDLFLADNNGIVFTISGSQENGVAGQWTPLVPGFRGIPGMPVTAVWRDAGHTIMNLFVADNNGIVFTISGNPASGWAGQWTPIHSEFRGQPGMPVTAVWRDTAQTILDLFVADNNGIVFTISRNPAGNWAGQWTPIHAEFRGQPGMPVTAIWRDVAQTMLDLFVADNNGIVFTISGNPASGWAAQWTPIVSSFRGIRGMPVTAVWRDAGHTIMDLFVVDNNGIVFTNSGNPARGWAGQWTPIVADFRAQPGARVTAQWYTPTSLCLFVADNNGIVFTFVANPANGWTGQWTPIVSGFHGEPGMPVTAMWHDTAQTFLELFVADNNGIVFTIAGSPYFDALPVSVLAIQSPFGDVQSQTGTVGVFQRADDAGINEDLHLCGVTNDGRLWHTIRYGNGSWQRFGDIQSQTGDRGSFAVVSCAAVNGELHVSGANRAGQLWHTIRYANGSWQAFGDVKGQTGDRGAVQDVACAGLGGDLHVCSVTSDGHLWHTIRYANGGWQAFGDVEGQAGDRGNFTAVSCAAVNDALHVCGVTSDGHLWHTIRYANGGWQAFGDVEGQAGDRGNFTAVSCTAVNDALHVCGVTSDGHLWHTIRYGNGGWQAFGDVEERAGDRGKFVAVGCSAVQGAPHVCGVTSDGKLWHTILN